MTGRWSLRRYVALPWRRGERIARDVDDEIAFHLEMRSRDLVDAGANPEAAGERARREFGDVEQARRRLRAIDHGREQSSRRSMLLDELRQDARYARRQLSRAPVFTTVAVVTLALGIGANTAIFSVIRGVLLRPLPYHEPQRVVRVFWGEPGGGRVPPSPLDVRDWREQTRSFATMSAFIQGTTTISGEGVDAEQVEMARVSASLLPMLGVRPRIGSFFSARDDFDDPIRAAVLSEGLWRRRFGADTALVGRSITLDGERFTVIGVARDGATYPADAELFVPLHLDQAFLDPHTRGARFMRVVARLKDGVTLAAAQSEMETIARRAAEQFPRENADLGALVKPVQDYLVADVRTPLLVLLGAVGFVLLIACANVANLLLVRAAAREGELAVRTALGAARGRIVRQLLTESMMLSVTGGAVGIALAVWLTDRLKDLAQDRMPRLADVHLDTTVLAVTVAASLIAGMLLGLAPALHSSAPDIAGVLKDRRTGMGRRAAARVRRGIVIAEFALAIVLLAGAGLLVRSFGRLVEVDPGFRADDVVTFSLALPDAAYPDSSRRRLFEQELFRRLTAVRGVSSVGAASGLPLSGATLKLNFAVEGRVAPPPGQRPLAETRMATADYFRTMGIPLLRGRLFAPDDRAGSPPVVVINAAAARRYFGGEDPIGQRIRFDFGSYLGGQIVGVIGDTRQFDLATTSEPEVYLLYDQFPTNNLAVVMRVVGGSPDAVLTVARGVVRELDRNIPVVRPRELREMVAESVSQPRFYMVLLGGFAAIAVLLAAVGIYGVVSYSVAQRTREIGVRMALGATDASVLRMVLGEALGTAAAGVAIGGVAARWATRLLGSQLYGVTATDPLTFVVVIVGLTGVAVAACMIPARRASRVDPVRAIRAE